MYSSSGFGNAGESGRAIAWLARIARKVTLEHQQRIHQDLSVIMPTYIVVTIFNQESHSLSFQAIHLGYVQYTLLARRDILQELAVCELLASIGVDDRYR